MGKAIESYIRQRSKACGLSLSELCYRAGISRQTLYEVWKGSSYPSLTTLVAIAHALHIHPMHLMQQVFAGEVLSTQTEKVKPGDRSAFVRDITVQDGEWVIAGTRFRKSWELQNTGSVVWEGRQLQCMDEELVVLSRQGEEMQIAPPLKPVEPRVAIPDTPPGETVVVSVELIAPALPGAMLSYWKMIHSDGSLCFPHSRGLWAKVQVITPASAAQ